MCWCGRMVWPRDCEYEGYEFAPLSLRTFLFPWMIIQIPSMAIDAHRKKLRWPSMAHRWAAMGPSMPIDGIEWDLSTGNNYS